MKTRLIIWWDRARTSYWFVPGLMTTGAILLSVLTVYLDQHVQEKWIDAVGWIWAGGADGAREVLSTIASSMINVAGVTFSITIVALQLASSQFGPRVLRNFMSDTGNQVVLGTFVATFLYCLLVLRTVRSVDQTNFVPFISITVGLALAVFSLGVLIYFVHHVSLSIRAEYVIATVATEFETALDRLYPKTRGEEAEDAAQADEAPDEPGDRDEQDEPSLGRFEDDSVAVHAHHSGYLQAIELDTLMPIASDHDLVLRLPHRPGDFVTHGDVLAQVIPPDRFDDSLLSTVRDSFILGRQRTPRQDIQHSVDQFAEIAVRALSPGINDPYTAVVCVDWLGAALSSLAERPKPVGLLRDSDRRLRIIAKPTLFSDITDAAFTSIRVYGRTSPSVSRRLLDAIADIAARARRREDRDVLGHHARLIVADAKESLTNQQDRAQIDAGYEKVLDAMARYGQTASD